MYGKNSWLIGTDSDISVLKAAGPRCLGVTL